MWRKDSLLFYMHTSSMGLIVFEFLFFGRLISYFCWSWCIWAIDFSCVHRK